MQYAMSWSKGDTNVCVNVFPENKNDESFLKRMLEECGTQTLRLSIQNHPAVDFEMRTK